MLGATNSSGLKYHGLARPHTICYIFEYMINHPGHYIKGSLRQQTVIYICSLTSCDSTPTTETGVLDGGPRGRSPCRVACRFQEMAMSPCQLIKIRQKKNNYHVQCHCLLCEIGSCHVSLHFFLTEKLVAYEYLRVLFRHLSPWGESLSMCNIPFFVFVKLPMFDQGRI